MSESYYDQIAPYYKYIYHDWESSVERQASMLQDVIREYFGDVQHILDAACGIGTQSIGLAGLGYTVTTSDISDKSNQRAHQESTDRGLDINFSAADMRELWQAHQQEFDLVIACDNAVPHLLNDDDILLAFQQFYRCTRTGGGCLISVRDYAEIDCTGLQIYPRQIHETDDGRIILFDVWDFNADIYEVTTYIVDDTGEKYPRFGQSAGDAITV